MDMSSAPTSKSSLVNVVPTSASCPAYTSYLSEAIRSFLFALLRFILVDAGSRTVVLSIGN